MTNTVRVTLIHNPGAGKHVVEDLKHPAWDKLGRR